MPRKGTTAETTTLVEPTPMAASWPARTWTPAERVTAGMMNTIRDQLNELHAGASQGESNADLIINKTFPALILKYTGGTAFGRVINVTPDQMDLTYNMNFDGASWIRDDVVQAGSVYQVHASGHYWFIAAAGANPATAVSVATLNGTEFVSNVRIRAAVGGNILTDLTCAATNFTVGIVVSGAQASTFAGPIYGAAYIYSAGVMYPGRIDNGAAQTSWYLASHASYGLYSNTGIYFAGPIYGGSLIQGILAPRIQAAAAGGIQTDMNAYDMVTVDYCNVATTFYVPLNPRNGQSLVIRIKDAGGAVALGWDGHFITGCPTAIPTATVAPSKLMSMAFRYAAVWDRWYMMAYCVEP